MLFRSNKRGWIGLMPVILLFIIRYWMIAHSWPNAFYSTSYFSPSVYASSAMLNSPLDLLFGVLCLLSLIIFFYSLITSEKIITRALSKQSIARAVFAMLIFLCFAYSYVINYLLNGLILNSQISFNTNNIFDLDTYSLIGFFVIGIVLTGFYFISIGTTYYIRRLGIKITSALLYFTCIALVFGLITKLSIGFYFSDAYTYYSFGFAFLLILFIIYVRVYFSKGFKQESIIFIVLGFSVYATLQIYSFNQIKESERQRSFANKIQSQKDNIADYLFDETKNKIKQDSIRVYQTATSLNNYEELNKFLINSYFSDYFSSYDITFYYLDKNGNCLNSASDESLNEIVKEYTYQSNGLLNYSGKLEKLKQYGVISTRFTNQITTCVVEFSNKRVGNGDGFPELLLSNKVNATKDLNDYSFARYKEGKLLYQSGSFNYYITSVPYEEDIKKSDEIGRAHV